MLVISWLIQLLFIPLLSPLALGIIKKIKAKLQGRTGASIFQMYRDIWKLLHKDEIISREASWIFRFAPFIIFSSTLVIGVSIPLFAAFLSNPYSGDLLVVIYMLALGTFFLALAGMDTGSGFGGFGSSREMTVFALAEAGCLTALFTISLITGTTNLFAMSNSAALLSGHFFLPIIFALASYFIVLLAETGRYPFDNPATHLELTMIHEAMILEYSGKRLALMEWAAANKFMILAALGANLFFPYGIAQQTSGLAIIFGIIVLLLKVFGVCLVIAIIESTIAKYRFFQLPNLLITSFILSAIAISLLQLV